MHFRISIKMNIQNAYKNFNVINICPEFLRKDWTTVYEFYCSGKILNNTFLVGSKILSNNVKNVKGSFLSQTLQQLTKTICVWNILLLYLSSPAQSFFKVRVKCLSVL